MAWSGCVTGEAMSLGTQLCVCGALAPPIQGESRCAEKEYFSGYSTVRLALHTLPTGEEHRPEINTLSNWKKKKKTYFSGFQE